MRTVIRSCLSHERSRCSLLRRAEPQPLSTFIMSPAEVGLGRKPHKRGARLSQTPCCSCSCCDLWGARLALQPRKLWLVGGCRDRPQRALLLTCPNVKNFFFYIKETQAKNKKKKHMKRNRSRKMGKKNLVNFFSKKKHLLSRNFFNKKKKKKRGLQGVPPRRLIF